MTELEQKTLTLLLEGKSVSETQQILQVPDSLYLKCLKKIYQNKSIISKYFSDGSVILKKGKKESPFNLKIQKNTDSLHVLFYSDLHAGNKKDRLELLDSLYEHATLQNIHILFNTGDVIENIYCQPASKLRQKTIEGQINYLLKHFPYSPSITNFILYGNHDHKALTDYDIDIATILQKERPDFISLGYGEANVDLGQDFITLQHNLHNHKMSIPENSSIVFRGHSHKMKIDTRKKIPIIFVPALGDAIPESYTTAPLQGFLDVTFTFTEDGKLDKVFINQYNTSPKKQLACECVLSLKKTMI